MPINDRIPIQMFTRYQCCCQNGMPGVGEGSSRIGSSTQGKLTESPNRTYLEEDNNNKRGL